jgi:hypothetical protein
MADQEELVKKVLRLQQEFLELPPETRQALLDVLPRAHVQHSEPKQAVRPKAARASKGSRGRRKVGRKVDRGSVARLAIKAVLAAKEPLWAGDVVREVRRTHPDANSGPIYTALYTAADDGVITKEIVGTKARYSKPHGGRKQLPPEM